MFCSFFLFPIWIFRNGFLLSVCSLFTWPSHLVYSEGMPADVGDWVTGMIWGRKGWRRWSLLLLGNKVIKEMETIENFLLQSWEWEWGYWISGAEDVLFCLLSICCLGRSCPWFSRGCPLELVSWTKQHIEGKRIGINGLWYPQEMLAGVRNGSLVFYFSSRDKTKVLSLWRHRE